MSSYLGSQLALVIAALFVGMLLVAEVGHRLGRRRAGAAASEGAGLVDTAIFALLGLLVAFTFSGASDRFEKRRDLIVTEANAIGTAYLRLDLLPPSARSELQALMRRYVDSRIAVYRALPDVTKAYAELDASGRIQQEIWEKSVAASDVASASRMLLLPALNDTFDITTTRTMAALTHTPPVIYYLLFGLALASSLLAGRAFAASERSHWLYSILYALTMAAAIYVIVDMEFPRAGLIRVDNFDTLLVNLRSSMK